MKRTGLAIISAILWGIFGLSSGSIAAETVQKTRLKFPYGDSYWSLAIQPAKRLDDLQIFTSTGGACYSLNYRIDFRDAQSGNWYAASLKNGTYQTSPWLVSELRIWFQQTASANLECDITLQSSSTTIKGRSTFVGALDYKGGLLLDTQIDLSRPVVFEHLQILVPAFCSGVEILEVKAGNERTVLSKSDGQGALWKLPAAQTIDKLNISLNGPSQANCQMPIYAYDLSP